MCSQSRLRIAAFTTFVTQYWPRLTIAGGCSDHFSLGITQLTAGSVPLRAAAK